MESPEPIRNQILADSSSNEAFLSGVSWPAVIAGAFVAAALSLILLDLGTGLGLSSVSLWTNSGLSGATVSKAAIFWLIITQITAFAMGGYLAGRLRTKWTIIHTDEVYFRDTAHGFLVWAVGLVMTAAFLASATSSLVGGIAQRPDSSLASVSGSRVLVSDPDPYFAAMLLRSDHISPDRVDPYLQADVARIFGHSLAQKGLSAPDRDYLTRLVAERTALPEAGAQARVEIAFSELQQSVDIARKTAAKFALWLFIALLAGAFCATYSATIGGRERDRVKLLHSRESMT
jgi:hypothetical protein